MLHGYCTTYHSLHDLLTHVDPNHPTKPSSNSFWALVGLPSSTHASSIIDGRPRAMKALEDALVSGSWFFLAVKL